MLLLELIIEPLFTFIFIISTSIAVLQRRIKGLHYILLGLVFLILNLFFQHIFKMVYFKIIHKHINGITLIYYQRIDKEIAKSVTISDKRIIKIFLQNRSLIAHYSKKTKLVEKYEIHNFIEFIESDLKQYTLYNLIKFLIKLLIKFIQSDFNLIKFIRNIKWEL